MYSTSSLYNVKERQYIGIENTMVLVKSFIAIVDSLDIVEVNGGVGSLYQRPHSPEQVGSLVQYIQTHMRTRFNNRPIAL